MRIMVLNDGTTWTDLAGCMIVDVPDDEDYDADVRESELRDLSEGGPFQLREDGPVRLFTFTPAHDIQIQDKDTGLVLFMPKKETA